MKQIVYISTAVKLMDDNSLLKILDIARKHNAEHAVTGVLLYSDGTFIQALEGPGGGVDNIYEAIVNDSRHKNITKLVDNEITGRSFNDWWMGFATTSPEKMNELTGYIQATDRLFDENDNSITTSIIKTFIATNNLEIV
jgi:hypothetical protein